MKRRVMVVPTMVLSAALSLWAASSLLQQAPKQAKVQQKVQQEVQQEVQQAGQKQWVGQTPSPGLGLHKVAYKVPSQEAAHVPGRVVTKPLQGAAATAELKKRGQYASLMGAVKQAMYGFKPSTTTQKGATANKVSFGAANAQQNFAAHFDARGVQVKTTEGESLRLQWQSVGRAGEVAQIIAPGQVALKGEELQLKRDGATEWFRNGTEGLEQGFTLHQKPTGEGAEVRLTLAASGLSARMGKECINLIDDKGKTALTYSKLKVWDADGKVLPARMEVSDGRILLAMHDRGARYPVTVDPLLATQQAYLKASNTDAGDGFGYSVAIDGESVVVGAYTEDSSAIGVNGNGADNSAADAGAAYVFVRSGATWSQQAYLKASNTDAGDNFGTSVAIDGDSVVVGASTEDSSATGVNGNGADNNAVSAGAAYVFVRSGGLTGTWSQQAYLKASNTEAFDNFGTSVAIDGESVVVGAYQEDSNASGVNGNQADNSAGQAGAAYVFSVVPDPAQSGADFEVNTIDDVDDGTCGVVHCSLREAIIAANFSTDVSVISFDATVFASAQTIQLTGALNNLSSSITINGPAPGVTILRSSGGNYSILVVNSSTVELSKLTLSNGQNNADGGGGLLNNGTVTLTDCTISGNSSTYAGGGLLNSGSMTLNRCTIVGNTANAASGFTGGGLDSTGGTLTLTNCTFIGNFASDGGQGSVGGALWLSSTATITNCTFSGNFANGTSGAGGIRVEAGSTTIGNSIVAGNGNINGANPDVSGIFISSGFNLIGATDGSIGFGGSGDQMGSSATPLDAKLGTLSNNGGLTQTIPLQGGSPAINTGDTALTTDQRGVARPQGTADDIGAFEVAALSVATTSVIEGNGGSVNLVFTVTLTTASSEIVTVDYQTADGSTFPATAGVDYDPTNGTLTFNPGDTTETVTVTVLGDTLDEFNERVALQLSNPTNAVIGTVNEGVIIDNDPAPTISINDMQVTETNGGTAQAVFTVSLSAASAKPITVLANTNSLGGSPAATPGTDYTAVVNKTIIFAPGSTTQPLNVSVLGDVSDENDEKFGVALSSATNASIADNSGVGTILDNDNPPVISATVANVTEGNSGDTAIMTFTLKLSAASGKNVSVMYKTTNSATFPATAGSDYVAIPQTTVTFLAGETTKTVDVTINGDLLDEPNERVALQLSNPLNATVGTVTDGIILDDDVTPTLSINDVSVTEGNTGTKLLTFTVTLSAASGQTVTVNAASSGGGSPAATAGSDYVALASTPISFAPGQTSKQISVTINGDTTVEANEKLGVILSGAVNATLADNSAIGTILNDDAPLIVAPAEVPSGGEGVK